jgi:hypothetical protein
MKAAFLVLNIALGITACVLGLVSAAPMGPAISLGIATLFVAHRWIGTGLGMVGVGVALAQIVPQPIVLSQVIAAIASGIAVGAFAYVITSRKRWVMGQEAYLTAIYTCVLALIVMLIPDAWFLLEHPDGGPLSWAASIQDTRANMRLETEILAWVPAYRPLVSLVSVIPVVAGLTTGLLLYARLTQSRSACDRSWYAVFVTGSLLVVIGASGLIQLLNGEVTLPAVDLIRDQYNSRTGGSLVVESFKFQTGQLGLGSRPAIDVCCLWIGLSLAVWGYKHGFTTLSRTDLQESKEPLLPRSDVNGLLILGTGMLLIATAALKGEASSLVWTGALFMVGAAIFIGYCRNVIQRLPYDLVYGGLIITLFGVLGPLAGWIPG